MQLLNSIINIVFILISVCRENDQIIGSYLEIEDVTLEDYGEYKCEVSNGVDEEITLAAHVYRQGPKNHPKSLISSFLSLQNDPYDFEWKQNRIILH